MAIGQFGRASTGSGSLASAISNLASDYANLRMDRIYAAFYDETTFDGQPMTAQNALALLNDMLKNVSEDSKLGLDISKTMGDVRRSNRNRILNNFQDDEIAKGEGGFDYQKKIDAINEMLMDPTLGPTDESALKGELTKSYNDMFLAATNQFSNGDKFTFKGQTLDFANGANSDAFVNMFDTAIGRNPELEEQIGKQRDVARAQVLVAAGNAAYLAGERKTYAQKLAGKKEQLAKLTAALKILEDSQYTLGQNSQTNQIRADIMSINDDISGLQDNIATVGTDNKLATVAADSFTYFNRVVKSIAKYPDLADQLSRMTGMANPDGAALLKLISTDVNNGAQIMDLLRSRAGNSVSVDGKSVDLTITGLYAAIVEHKGVVVALDDWARGNKFVSSGWKEAIASWKDAAITAVGNQPLLKLEDAYDNAKERMRDGLYAAGGNLSMRVAVLKQFSRDLTDLSKTYANTQYKDALYNEAVLYSVGKLPTGKTDTYGDMTGNYGNGSSEASYFGQVISPTTSTSDNSQYSVLAALQLVYNDWQQYKSGNGTTYSDPLTGEDVTVVGAADTTNYGNGASMKLTALDTVVDANGNQIFGSTATVYKRYSIWDNKVTADASDAQKRASRQGWVTVYIDAQGQKQYILTRINNGKEYVVNAADTAAFIRSIGINNLRTVGGENGFIWTETDLGALRGAGSSGALYTSDITTGSESFYKALTDAGITIIEDNRNAVTAQLTKLFESGNLVVENGAIYTIDGKGVKTAIGKYLTNELRDQITGAYIKYNQGIGGGSNGEGSTHVDPQTGQTVPGGAPAAPSGTVPTTTPTKPETFREGERNMTTPPVSPPVVNPSPGPRMSRQYTNRTTNPEAGVEGTGARPISALGRGGINRIGSNVNAPEVGQFFRNMTGTTAATGGVSSSTGRYVPGTRNMVTRKAL